MKFQVATLAFLCLCGAAGCRVLGPTQVTLSGIVLEDTATNTFLCTDLTEPQVQGYKLAVPVSPNLWIESKQMVKIDVKQHIGGRFYDYHAVMGPTLPGQSAYWRLRNTEPTIEVDAGWALIWGRYGRADTRWVTAASYGTTFVVEVADSATHRTYLLRGTGIAVECNRGSNQQYIATEGQFVEIDGTCAITAPADIASVPDRAAFIARIEQIALCAGWNE